MSQNFEQRLREVSVDLERLLTRGGEGRAPQFAVPDIRIRTERVPMRDGILLATDLYLPPVPKAPVVVMRTPYGRSGDGAAGAFLAFARRGYAVVSQDCRGTGDSEPESWDYYVYESEDGYDLVEWICGQDWYGGFIGSCGGSYVGQTQWPMALHPAMSTIVPHVSGLGIGHITVHFHMFANGYGRTVGKGAGKLNLHYSEIERAIEAETMASGYFNEPLHRPFSPALLAQFPDLRGLAPDAAKRWLWTRYSALPCSGRAAFLKQAMGAESVSILEVENSSELFGHQISHDAHTIPHADPALLCRLIRAPALLLTGWYDWCLNDALATWVLMRREGRPEVAERMRLILTPHAHNAPGYHEGIDRHAELQMMPGVSSHAGVLMRWYEIVRGNETESWPRVIYYLMGANEWRVADDWPVPQGKSVALYLTEGGHLSTHAPSGRSNPDQYTYDPTSPTPTVGGSIVSYLYPPGSVDVSEVQRRADLLVYTSPPLEQDLDVVGPLSMILYASSSALDTDFAARLSDVFPDGRAIQLQNCMLRARYREAVPKLLEPGRIYRLEIDLWATANRFKAGHRLRVDIASSDFPKFDRNTNRGGEPGDPVSARQCIFHDPEHPSHLSMTVLGDAPSF